MGCDVTLKPSYGPAEPCSLNFYVKLLNIAFGKDDADWTHCTYFDKKSIFPRRFTFALPTKEKKQLFVILFSWQVMHVNVARFHCRIMVFDTAVEGSILGYGSRYVSITKAD